MLNKSALKTLRRITNSIAFFIVVGLLAVAAMVCAVLVPQLNADATKMWIVLGAAIAVFLVSIIVLAVCGSSLSKFGKKAGSAGQNGADVGDVDDVEISVRTTYMQSAEERLRQIDMMDKSQFVVYIAGLYSIKGYKVDISRVDEQCGIDMIINKDGVKTGISCMLSSNLLINEHVLLVEGGKNENKLKNVVMITNSYFDQTAVAQAKRSQITLMDRDGLVAFGRLV